MWGLDTAFPYVLWQRQKANQSRRSMTDVFKFPLGCFPGYYRLVQIFVLQCLDTCHLIYRYRVAARFPHGFRFMVNGTDFIHLSAKVSGESTISSLTTASTSRLRLQLLASYPDSSGLRQAISRILMTYSSV